MQRYKGSIIDFQALRPHMRPYDLTNLAIALAAGPLAGHETPPLSNFFELSQIAARGRTFCAFRVPVSIAEETE